MYIGYFNVFIIGLGNGWNVARINDNIEYLFVNQAHLADYYRRSYFVGGTTASPDNDDIRLNQTFGFSDNSMILV